VRDDGPTPKMFSALWQWANNLYDLGDLPSALSAAESLCREARTTEEQTQAYRLAADLHERRGDLDAARPYREALVEVARRAAAADADTTRRLDLLAALDDLGELARRQEDHWTVLECHGNHGRMAVLRELTEQHGLRVSLLTEQCYSLRRAGTAARELRSYEEARSLLDERLTVARLTCAGNPGDPHLVALVAAALTDLGALLAHLGDRRAPALLSEEVCLRQWLRQGRPAEADAVTWGSGSGSGSGRGSVGVGWAPRAGVDTAEHLGAATALLAHLEREGSLDATGRLLLTSLRTG